MNYSNFDINKEEADQRGDEWQFGSLTSQPSMFIIPVEERKAWLPEGEVQATNSSDTFGCASRAPNNIFAPLFTYGFQKFLFSPKNLQWLKDKGYVVNGKIDFSDRFIEILSGTTRAGNSLKAPIDTARTKGLIPKWMLPLDKSLTFEQYYDASCITKAMLELGQEFSRRFTLAYEQVQSIHFKEALEDDCLSVALYAWPDPVNGEYPPSSAPFNHAVAMWKPEFFIFDNYNYDDPDWIKKLSPNYKFYPVGYRVYISGQNDTLDQQISLMQRLIALLLQLRDALKR